MKPWIYIFIITEKLNFAKMSVTTLLHSHDELSDFFQSKSGMSVVQSLQEKRSLTDAVYEVEFLFMS